MTFDEKLAQALSNTAKARAEQMLAVPKEHKFSLAYRLWESRTLKNLSRNRYDKRWTLRKAKRIIATAMIAAASLLLGITASAIAIMGRFGFDPEPEYSRLLIESSLSDKTRIEEYYGLPEEDGWQIVDYYADDTEIMISYECNEKKVIFGQRIMKEGAVGNINTEKTDPEPVSLYEKNDGFILVFRENECIIYWIYDGYLLDLSGNITKDEAINLAYSTKIVNLE